MNENERTMIPISKGTRERLKTFGDKADTYDFILNCLMDKAETEASQ